MRWSHIEKMLIEVECVGFSEMWFGGNSNGGLGNRNERGKISPKPSLNTLPLSVN